MKQYDAKEAKVSFLITMHPVYMYIGNFIPCCIYYTYIIAASNATSTHPQIGNSSKDSISDSPVAVYKANVASGQLRYDEL